MIVTPTLVADRVVQLAPAYTGGAVMADKAVIPEQRTGIPQELDQVFANLNDLAKDVGPNGANKNGALSGLFSTAADNLAGNGQSIHTTINSIADLAGTLDDNKSAFSRRCNNLNSFTATLAAARRGHPQLHGRAVEGVHRAQRESHSAGPGAQQPQLRAR